MTSAGEDSGLGPAITTWSVEAQGGQLQANNAIPHGAVVIATLQLPRQPVSV